MATASFDSLTAWLLLPTASLWRREVVRFLRQRSRVVGALGTPVVFWLLIGSGLRHSFAPPGTAGAGDYLRYSYAGMMVLVVMFTAIFSTISIVEDRREGFLQGVLVAPVSRLSIVMGKILGSTTLALGQAAFFLALGPAAGIPLTVGSVFAVLGVLLVISLGLSAMGFLIAWHMDSIQGFHAVMNLFLMPLWLLSGAFFPLAGASLWLRGIMHANPLTYGVAALRHALDTAPDSIDPTLPSLTVSLGVMIAFTAGLLALAARAVDKRS